MLLKCHDLKTVGQPGKIQSQIIYFGTLQLFHINTTFLKFLAQNIFNPSRKKLQDKLMHIYNRQLKQLDSCT